MLDNYNHRKMFMDVKTYNKSELKIKGSIAKNT
ncbi:hypothetical protein SERP0492 [Staphylococcus epidermidis RP62A]|uniref:Uncharacterized protein n=1 Tax=Staphylococcus epidermidis (strain ATCC 35984 / DSM 28319 / BCRC 17069 / CCUG 31568 / BM 3577 / RP62A) TaxID=176279 RepID=Q5HQQ6_STAEQ|nr:hypothetical protein SERP0492 [Staphylococcus epidermidis RP62A]